MEIKIVFRNEDESLPIGTTINTFELKAKVVAIGTNFTPIKFNVLQTFVIPDIPIPQPGAPGNPPSAKFIVKIKAKDNTENDESNIQRLVFTLAVKDNGAGVLVQNTDYVYTLNVYLVDIDQLAYRPEEFTDDFDTKSTKASKGSTIVIGAGMP